MNENLLILVDKNDNETGVMDKLTVHQKGVLHRAFSIFVFNSNMELLLQQRADDKYHSGGLWSNTCCSHPLKNEIMEESVVRRLKEEMGIECNTEFKFSFIYKHLFENGLTKHELDHVYFGNSDQIPVFNPKEVKAYRYIGLEKLEKEISEYPDRFTIWLRICFPLIKQYFSKNKP